MKRKSISILLMFVMCFLLITGCSTGSQQTEPAGDKTEEETQGTGAILPEKARIGIADVHEDGDFASSFIAKLTGYLVSAGVPEEQIERKTGSGEELVSNAADLISGGCNVVIIGNADETTAPSITDEAVKAGIPLLYFGTSPGDKEISRWEKEGWKVCYIGSTFDTAAGKRADLFDATDLAKIDQNEDDTIGIVILDSGNETAGDIVNRDSVSILSERGYDLNILTESSDEEDAEEEDTSEEEDTPEEEVTSEEEDTSEEEVNSEEDETSEEDAEPSNEKREAAKEQIISWMDEYGKELEVILCPDDVSALGAVDAIGEEKRKVGHDVMILGFDCNTDSLREVAAGNITETFFNDFLGQAGSASEAVLAFLKGDSVDPLIISEYVNVTVDNAQEILDISLKTQENTETEEDKTEE